ncbi:MAG TPA: PQQ-dependent sugar dehydrogenase, partial [Actinomycetes bacterium]
EVTGAAPLPTTPRTPSGPPTQRQLDGVAVRLVQVAKLDQPVALTSSADGTTLYVAERAGRVRVVRDGRLEAQPLLDLSGEVATEGEGGLLGLALAPNGRHLYASFTDRRHAVRVVEFAVAGHAADPASRRAVLTVQQASIRHHGGNLVFGPDGLLWLGLGDGSAGGDPADAAQSLDVLNGKLLRLDPRPSGRAAYGVPATNPFVGRRGARPEIWAYGLRNPWRFSFDRATGDLWIGDVGQYVMEEVDVVAPARAAGANFGWRRLEGRHHFKGSPPAGAVPPIYQYNHNSGRCAVVGGHVYRGSQVAGLAGAYVFGDVCDGHVRALVRVPGKPPRLRDLGVRLPGLVSFAEDGAGELLLLSLSGGVQRLVAAG